MIYIYISPYHNIFFDRTMFNIIKYLQELIGKEIIVKTKFGLVKGVLIEVGNNGALLLDNYETISGKIEPEFDGKTILIRGDNIVAVMIGMEET